MKLKLERFFHRVLGCYHPQKISILTLLIYHELTNGKDTGEGISLRARTGVRLK